MTELIESFDELMDDDEWFIKGVEYGGIVITSSGEVAQLSGYANSWDFYDLDSGEYLDTTQITEDDFPLTVVARDFDLEDDPPRRKDGTPHYPKDAFRERKLVEYFHKLDGGPSVLSGGAL